MDFAEYFPVFDRLSGAEQEALLDSVILRKIGKGTVIHSGSDDCLGLLVIRAGQLRAFMLSEQGREITVYRLFDRDMCLFSASCVMNSIQFDISIEAEKDTEAWLIPIAIYKDLLERSAVVANYTNEVMSSRFTDVMWLMEQILWKSFDRRLAGFLLVHLKITHEQIASHLGTAREVVSRMLKYFRDEGMITLMRGAVELTDMEKLRRLSG